MRRMRVAMLVLVAMAAMSIAPISGAQQRMDLVYLRVPGGEYDWLTVDPYGSVIRKYLWTTREIPICWDESPVDSNDARLRGLVQTAVKNSWQKYSKILFTGWGICENRRSAGVHILVRDSLPKTSALGNYLNGRYGGLTLNFQLLQWETPCRDGTKKDDCIRYLAVHEFGHVLGFVHENIRADSPPACRDEMGTRGARGNWDVTQYDQSSIMNYCSSWWRVYADAGGAEPTDMPETLSDKDRIAVDLVYGANSKLFVVTGGGP